MILEEPSLYNIDEKEMSLLFGSFLNIILVPRRTANRYAPTLSSVKGEGASWGRRAEGLQSNQRRRRSGHSRELLFRPPPLDFP